MNWRTEQPLHWLKIMLRSETVNNYSNLLTIRTSGDLLELSTKTGYHQNPEEYRKAVIKAGRFLQAIRYESDIQGEQLLIQSFPSFEEDRLIAIVRHIETAPSTTATNQPEPVSENSVIRIFTAVASHHGLFFNASTSPSSDIRKAFETQIETSSDDSFPVDQTVCFSLCSTTDNPFIWLKTGQWIEEILNLVNRIKHLPEPIIESQLPADKRNLFSTNFEECSYCQALVFLPLNTA